MEEEQDDGVFIVHDDSDDNGGSGGSSESGGEGEDVGKEHPSKRQKTEEEDNSNFVSVYDVDNDVEVLEEVPVSLHHHPQQQEDGEELFLEGGSCPICLEKLDNPSIPECCFHRFCFICILQWSSLAPSCPLCKKNFSYIIHHVKSEREYKIFHLEQRPSKPKQSSLSSSRPSSSSSRPSSSSSSSSSSQRSLSLQSITTPSIHHPRSSLDTHALRRAVYARGLRAHPPPSLHFTPSMLQRPPLLEKIKTWITRELQAVLQLDNVELLVQVVLSLLKQYPIHDPAVSEHLKEYLGEHTDIFLHELVCFACSSHPSMAAYDKHVRYDKHKARDGSK